MMVKIDIQVKKEHIAPQIVYNKSNQDKYKIEIKLMQSNSMKCKRQLPWNSKSNEESQVKNK